VNLIVFDVGHDDGLRTEAPRDVVVDETVIDRTVKAVTPAFRIKPQQMIAQQRQLLVPQNADRSCRLPPGGYRWMGAHRWRPRTVAPVIDVVRRTIRYNRLGR